VKLLEREYRRCVADGDLYWSNSIDLVLPIAKVFQGNIREGLHLLEAGILKHEKAGYTSFADCCRVFLAEMYLQIISGNEKLPLWSLVRNLPIILKVMTIAPSRVRSLTNQVLENAYFDPAGHHVAYAKMLLGLLYKAKKKTALAVKHLTEARAILSQFGDTPLLARLDAALAELSMTYSPTRL
jgi:hypothetical protein